MIHKTLGRALFATVKLLVITAEHAKVKIRMGRTRCYRR